MLIFYEIHSHRRSFLLPVFIHVAQRHQLQRLESVGVLTKYDLNFFKSLIYFWRRFLRPIVHHPNQEKLRRRFIFFSLYAWGIPLIIVVIGQIFDNLPDLNPDAIRPNFGQEACWFPISGNQTEMWKKMFTHDFVVSNR